MSYTLVLVTAFYLVGRTHGDLSCGKDIKTTLLSEKKQCATDLIQLKLHNNTGSSIGKSCTSMQDIEDKFAFTYNNLSHCYNNYSDVYTKMINSSMKTRLEFLKSALEDEKVNDFIDNGGLQCLKENGPAIVQYCLLNILPNATSIKSIRYSLFQMGPLIFSNASKRACSQQSRIANCTLEQVKNCHNATATLIESLHRAMSGYCNNTTVNIQARLKPSGSTSAGTIIGALVGVVILVGLALFLVKKIPKCSKPQARSYSVAYEAKEN